MAGAAAFGLVSALVRAVSQAVVSGQIGAARPPRCSPRWPASSAAVLVGGWLVQQAFASGPPEVVIACLTVVDPIVAVLLGAVLLGEGAATPARLVPAGWSPRSPPPRASSCSPGTTPTRRPREPPVRPGAAATAAVPPAPSPPDAQSRPPSPTAGDPSAGTCPLERTLVTSLRILIGAETYPPDVNGAARFAERLAGGLAGRGHDVHVVAPSPDRAAQREVRATASPCTACARTATSSARATSRSACRGRPRPATAALLDEIDPDVVHTQAHMVRRPRHGEGRAPHRPAARGDQPPHAGEPRRATARCPRLLQRAVPPHGVEGPRPRLRQGRRGHRAHPARGRAAGSARRAGRRVPRLLRHRRRPLPHHPRTPSPTSPPCCSSGGWTRRSGSTS